jgi:hypothetical protein
VFVRSPGDRNAARELIERGIPDTEIARRLGLPRTTIRDWRRRPYARAGVTSACERCWRPMTAVHFDATDYAEFLGLYLGDGHISRLARTERLRITLDSRHANVVAEAAALLERCFPNNRMGRHLRHHGAMAILSVYHSHLSCLFPQHGPGKKHHRQIILESWQQAVVDAAPWAFLRGCIRSDGCVFINRTGRYEYVSYEFSNRSEDIKDLFMATAASVGLRPRRYARYLRLYRREDVALLLEHVGRKD